MILPLLLIIVVVVAVLMIDGLRHRVLFKMGFRNIFRRKTNTMIVILGLMIATAIISSSFGVGDTMENMVEGEVYKEWDKTDVTVFNTTEQGTFIPVPYETYLNLKSDILEVDNVGGVIGEVHGSTSVFNPDSRLSKSDTRLIGMDFEESDAFGPFYKDSQTIEFDLAEGEIIIDEKLAEEIEAEVGEDLNLFTIGYPQGQEYTIAEIVDSEGRAAFRGTEKVLMSLTDGQNALGIPDQINYIRVTSIAGVEEGAEYSDQIFEDVEHILQDDPSYAELEAQGNKNQNLESFKQDMAVFTDLFFIFGTFVIVAAIILTINIFVMLGEERKPEMGMSRAIGMKRSHLRRVFSYEGLFYAGGASIVGALTGIGLAYVIFFFLEDIFSTFGGELSLLSYFHFTQESLILAFGAGFLLTMGTILFAVTRISKLNIIRAIREIPEPPISKKSRKLFYLALIGLVLGALLTFAGTGSQQLWLPVTGISLVIIGIGTIARRWVGDRAAYTTVGIFLIIWWFLPLEVFSMFENYTTGIEMFILSGLFLVTAGVMIIMLNGSIITSVFEKIVGSSKGSKAVVMSGISHPLKERFRTGMTMFIFALIIFAIIVMSMIVGIFNTNLDRMIEEQSGGYEILGLSDQDRPIDDIVQDITDNENLDIDDFEYIHSASRGMVTSINEDGTRGRSSVIGVDQEFVDNNAFKFSEYLDEYDSIDEVWEVVMNDAELVITNDPGEFGMPTEDGVELGSTITFLDKNGEPTEKKVIGFMDQMIVNGFFTSKETAQNEFNPDSNSLFFFSVIEGVDVDHLGRDMQREFIRYGFQPIVIDTLFREAMTAQFMFFDLFSGYMGLGLVVGIAGLGIISLRAVHERRLEIGMMRAIGFKRRMIRYVFLIENSFITIAGIILGSLLGIGVGWLLWYDGFKPMGWGFYIPWGTILVIGMIAYLAMLFTAIPSAQKASKVSPAEALRFD
ncbi:MAG: FtsX-like permease family protein [Candidatus Natronoplasma sp.]